MIDVACPCLQPAQYRPVPAYGIKPGKSGTRRSPEVYALLMIVENTEEKTTIDVNLNNWEDLAIASNIAPDLHRIADAVG